MSDILTVLKDIEAGNLKPVYVFHGPERLLYQLVEEKIRSLAGADGFGDFNISMLSGLDTGCGHVLDSCETLPVMAERRYVVVRDCNWFAAKPNLLEDEETRLLAYFKNPNPSTVLVLQTDSTDGRNKFFKAIQTGAYGVPLNKLPRKELGKWIAKKVKQNGKNIENMTVEYLIEATGYDDKNSGSTLYDIENILDKVCGHASGESIERGDVDRSIEKPLEKTVFDMTDAVGGRNTELALKIYRKLLEDGESEGAILALISRHFRMLKKTKHMTGQGLNPSVIAERLSIPPFAAKKYHGQATRFEEAMLDQILCYCLDCDYRSKTGLGTMEKEIEMLIMKACFINML